MAVVNLYQLNKVILKWYKMHVDFLQLCRFGQNSAALKRGITLFTKVYDQNILFKNLGMSSGENKEGLK